MSFSREKLVVPESWQLMIVAWFMFTLAANINSASSGLLTFILTHGFPHFASSTFIGAVVFIGIPLFIIAPINEEWVKNYFYRRLSNGGKSYYAFIMSFAFSAGEALLYWASGNPFGLSWSDLVGRTVFPFHVFNYFVSYRFNFSWKGQGIATIFHSVNNFTAFMIVAEPFYFPWNDLSQLFIFIYCLNYLVMVAVSWHILKNLGSVSTKAV